MSIQLTTKQEEAIRSKARYKVLNWGRRSGKTTEFAYEALGTALTIDGAKITYYAQTFGDARDIAWDIFLEVFGETVLKKNETLLELTIANLKGGTSKISLKGWESVVTTGKGRGTENDLLLVDEVAFCRNFNEFYETVLDPTLLTTNGRAVFGSTPNGFNQFYQLTQKALLNPNGEWMYSHATSFDNPFNDTKWLDNKKIEIGEDRFAQEYLADFRKLEGLVYKEFDRKTHVFEDLNSISTREIIGGLDFGFTNPTALYKIIVDNDKRYWVTEEWYKTGKTNAEVIEYAKTTKIGTYYPDPAEPDRIEEMRRAGLSCREVSKDVTKGIDTIKTLLRTNRLKVHTSCVNLINEFETYAYREQSKSNPIPEEPIKEHDHGLDAIRYALHMKEPEPEINRALKARIERNRQDNARTMR